MKKGAFHASQYYRFWCGNYPVTFLALRQYELGEDDAPTQALSFEVASIKPHPGAVTFSADPMVRGSRVTGTACTLLDMITSAYGIRYDQVSGGTGWIASDRFDIDAKSPGDAPPTADQAHRMMQALLADRFRLKVHREMKEVPVYALVVGKSGAKLKQSAPDAAPGGFVRATDKGLHMEATKGTMERLAAQLSTTAGRPVIDKTGLTGTYEYTLDWFEKPSAN